MRAGPPITPVAERFWPKVDVKDPDGCWNWKAASVRQGYGHFRIGNKLKLAHRVSWELHNGPVPEGKLVLHKCNNKKCVNPSHLYLGTYSDNTSDKLKSLGFALCCPGRPKIKRKEQLT